MFNSRTNERLVEWKHFRDTLETSLCPLEDVADFWSQAPFVSDYLDPNNSSEWPDPWHLILDGRFDNFAIVLGMLYTLQLTQRFMTSKFEIHMSIESSNVQQDYWLIVDDIYVLNYHIKQVVSVDRVTDIPATIIYQGKYSQ